MLEQLICYLMTGLGASNYFDKIFPLVELIQKGDNLRPAQYIGKGQFQDVTKFDNYNGMAYFRQTSSEKVSKFEPEGAVPCDVMLQIEYPLRLVACIPKSKLTKDDAFVDERIAAEMVRLITSNGGLIVQQIAATNVTFTPSEIITRNKEVLSQEYEGFGINDINFAFAYLAIDFNAIVQIKASCIKEECEDYAY